MASDFGTWDDIRANAKKLTAPKCAQCPVCNGKYCAGVSPGPGGKGSGSTFQRNAAYLRDHVKLDMRSLGEPGDADTGIFLFDRKLSMPVMAAPLGMVKFSYGVDMTDFEYDDMLLAGLEDACTIGFTGGGVSSEHFLEPLRAVKAHTNGIPTIKPWAMDKVRESLRDIEEAGPVAFAMDVDSAGLAHSKMSANPQYRKTAAELAEIAGMSRLRFIVKGIMPEKEAAAAAASGAYAIVVSNHGGRVIEDGLSTAEVLPGIASKVRGRVKIFVDGGVRTGTDVFKMLALGADAVLVGRPFATAVIGGGREGAAFLAGRLKEELEAAMRMTDCRVLSDITPDKVRIV